MRKKKWLKCSKCNGKGYILYTESYPFSTGWCRVCKGKGKIKKTKQ